MTPNETPTPLTDAAFAHHQDFPHDDEGDPWLLASNFERRNAELAAALEWIDTAKADSPEALVQKIKTKAFRALAAKEGGEG